MKKTGKILSSLAIYTLIANNAVYAATETVAEDEGLPTKYIFLGVAAVVIILLLFLGYKMDSKGDEGSAPKQPKKESKKKKVQVKEDSEYEADNDVSYESDHVDEDNLNDETEYEEDDEETLYSMDNEEELNPQTEDQNEETPVEEENFGEEFDTSIIDEIEDEDEVDSKSSDNTTASNDDDIAMGNLENEIDDLDNLDDVENINLDEDTDSFVNELKNFKEPESDFQGFSVVPSKDENTKENKKSKIEKKEAPVEEEFDDIQAGNDFLAQMEENLEKNGKDKKSKKTVSKKSSTKKQK
jgi:hypothetical protein